MADEQTEYKHFDVERQQIAQELAELKDKSPKGTIDEPIRRFLDLINSHPDWISTSTCSGRLVSYLPGTTIDSSSDQVDHRLPGSSRGIRQAVNGKGGGNWLFVSHSTLDSNQLDNPIETLLGNACQVDETVDLNTWTCDDSSPVVHLVYQPPVFHLVARSVAVAVPILTTVIGAGFRNSGITIGHRGRVILAIRASTGGLDVPIAIKKHAQSHLTGTLESNDKLKLLVPVDYLAKLLHQANRLMQLNESKLQRLFEALSSSFRPVNPKSIDHQWESMEDRRRRMKSEGLATRAACLASRSTQNNLSASNDEDIPELSLIE